MLLPKEPPDPLIMVHCPVPTEGLFPLSVVDEPQTVWSTPALAVVGGDMKEITTSS